MANATRTSDASTYNAIELRTLPRDHTDTCDGASTASSSRRRACDRCVRQKKACNSAQPCQNCQKRAVECQYSNLTGPRASAPRAINNATADDAQQELSQPDSTECLASSLDDVVYDDLDALIQQAVSQFPVVDNQSVPDDWLAIDFSHAGPPAGLGSVPYEPLGTSNSSGPDYRGYSFRFLYDFTSRTGLVSSFECATLAQRQQIVASFHHSYLEQQHPEFLGVVPPLLTEPEEAGSQPLGVIPSSVTPDHELASWSSWLHNPIVIKLQQVVLLIKSMVMAKPNNSSITPTWSFPLEQRCLQFFSPSRFAKFIELYWSVWHPNVNILHRPTFDPENSKPILLAAMALIGACVSPDSIDNEDARVWFNCVEEMVFADDDFCRDIDPPPVSDTASPISVPVRRKLQALQAAYIVCLYQNWEGTDAGKRRIRRHRFGTVVSVARDMGIDTAKHPEYSTKIKHEFDWGEYVVREELIRIFVWIFLLDTCFVIFNNLPHRMVIKEMKMHMASPEACFQAATAEECIEQIHRWMPPSSPFCSLLLREALEHLFIEAMTPDSQQKFSLLGPVNLFAMVSAIHYMIFQHQNLFGVEGQLVPIRNGLRNWIGIWERYAELPPSASPHGILQDNDTLAPELMWKRVGFVRFSSEYWLLGSLLIDRISSTTITSPHHSSQDSSFPGAFPDSSNARGKARSVEPILDKYDQTSMRQVNDLITDFQKFHVE
ncbi:Zinc finger protein klf1 [Madurella mycetomatis]|uniref:Zinc finger protein klf1 n=1 Tax=Madurella mycetomatis TaxID=100816 RepID=A0A175WDP6_9PEZI|nr:Zinc finger protein klf1 [Madurella mycetomatis]